MSRKSKRVPAQNRAPVREQRSPWRNTALKIAAIFFLAAAGIAAWLLFYALTEKPMAGCGPGSPCDRVMGSAWAYLFNMPVSAPALGAYLLLLGCATALAFKKDRPAIAWNLGTLLSF